MAGDTRISYPYEVKLAAVLAHIDGGMTSSDAMAKHGVKSKSAFFRWCAAYRECGEDALKPQKRGRPPKSR